MAEQEFQPEPCELRSFPRSPRILVDPSHREHRTAWHRGVLAWRATEVLPRGPWTPDGHSLPRATPYSL